MIKEFCLIERNTGEMILSAENPVTERRLEGISRAFRFNSEEEAKESLESGNYEKGICVLTPSNFTIFQRTGNCLSVEICPKCGNQTFEVEVEHFSRETSEKLECQFPHPEGYKRWGEKCECGWIMPEICPASAFQTSDGVGKAIWHIFKR